VAGGVSQLVFRTVECKNLIIFHGLGEGICCPHIYFISPLWSARAPGRPKVDRCVPESQIVNLTIVGQPDHNESVLDCIKSSKVCPTIIKLTRWACGTNSSTLERKRARAQENGEPK